MSNQKGNQLTFSMTSSSSYYPVTEDEYQKDLEVSGPPPDENTKLTEGTDSDQQPPDTKQKSKCCTLL